MDPYRLLSPPATITAPGRLISGVTRGLYRHAWSWFCFLVLPAVYLGLLGEFTLGRKTIIPPSLVLVGACMLLFAGFAAMHLRRLARFPLALPVVWYVLAACLSGWHSVSHLHWIRGVMELALAFCFLFFPYFFLRNRRQLELCLKVLVLLAAANVSFAILQAAFFSPARGLLEFLYRREDLWWIVGWGWRGRIAGNWVHPSYLGSVLNVAAPFALLAYLRADGSRGRIRSLIIYLMLAGGIALTGTRTPILAFLVSSAVLIGLARAPRRAWATVACATALVVTLSLFHFRLAPPDVGSTTPLPESIALADRFALRGSKSAATLDMRWNTQGEALSLFRTSPWFGIGMRNYPDRAPGDPMAQFSIHNSLAQNLSELGLFGLAAFLVLICATLRTDFLPQLSVFPELRPLRAALFCSSAAILLESLAENSLSIWQVMALFWLIRGISLVIARNPAAFVSVSEPAHGAEQQQIDGLSHVHALGSFPAVAG